MKCLSPFAREFLNDPARIARQDEWFHRMRCLRTGEYDPYNEKYAYALAGTAPSPEDPALPYTSPEDWVIGCLELLAQAPESSLRRFSPPCVSSTIYGVHFIDIILGADVFFKDDQWNVRYLTTPIGQLQMPDLDKDETWALARRTALAFVEADVRLPLFSTPILSSALNIFINLYGQEGLIAMMEDEDAAAHDLQLINDLIRTLHKWYRDHIPARQLQGTCATGRIQPPGSGQLCGCTTQLLSGSLYRDKIAPLDDALLGDYPLGGMIHLCGAHAQHIETFRNMPHLSAIQINDRACLDLDAYLAGMRKDQIIYVCPFEDMPADKIMSISGGDRVVLVQWDDAPEKK